MIVVGGVGKVGCVQGTLHSRASQKLGKCLHQTPCADSVFMGMVLTAVGAYIMVNSPRCGLSIESMHDGGASGVVELQPLEHGHAMNCWGTVLIQICPSPAAI